MKVVIQRVLEASVSIDAKLHASIGAGLLVLVGITNADTQTDIDWLCSKISNLRIFNDSEGQMNLSLQEAGGALMAVSQFTLFASTRKGNRPSYILAARPDHAKPLYEQFVQTLAQVSGKPVATGVFGADMKISLINDGPVTIIIDSQNRE